MKNLEHQTPARAKVSATDSITVLESLIPLTKTWKQNNGKIEVSAYGNAKYFSRETVEVNGISQLSALLTELEHDKNKCIIRGKYTGVEAARADPEYKRGENNVLRRGTAFKDTPQHFILVEIDDFVPLLCDPNLDPESAILEEFIPWVLPPSFQGVSFHWQLSSSAGLPKNIGKLKAHVWFWLETPYTSGQLKAWAKSLKLNIDTSVFTPVQMHYTAVPVFDGCDDPIKVRSGFVKGDKSDEVALAIDQESLDHTNYTNREGNSTGSHSLTLEDAQVLLAYIPPNCGYETWTKVIAGIKYEFGEDGLDLVDEWSSKSNGAGEGVNGGDYKGREDVEAVFNSFNRNSKGNVVTGATIKFIARGYGFNELLPSVKRELIAGFDDVSGGVEAEATISTYDYSPFELKPVEYVVDGFIGTGLTTIAGAPGVGKSSLLVPLAAAVAHCYTSPLNPELRRKVLYLAEDTDQVSRCLYGVSKAACVVSEGEFTARFKILQSKRLSPVAIGKLISKFVKENTVFHNGYAAGPLIVIDTSNANLDLESENDNAEVGKAISAIKENLGNAACWLVTHTPKTSKNSDVSALSARGSSAFEGDANQTAYIFDDGIASKRFMKGGKVRFEPEFSELEFTTSVISETVKTQWGSEQSMKIRFGIPDKASTANRMTQKETEKTELKEQETAAKKAAISKAILAALDASAKGKNQIFKQVKGHRETVLGLIDEMEASGVLAIVRTEKGHSVYGKNHLQIIADSTGGVFESTLA